MATTTGLVSTIRSAVDEHAPDLGDLRERADELRERAGAAPELVRQGISDLEPLARSAAIKLLDAFQVALRVMVLTPRLALRAMGPLKAAAAQADDARDRGAALAGRARDAMRAVPPSRRGRWRRRAGNAGLLGGGFLVGVIVGWLLAQRRPADLGDDAVVLQPVGEGDSAGGQASGSGAGQRPASEEGTGT